MKINIKNKIFTNGIYLYILQIFNTVIPLITLPYITRVLGIEQYGVFSKTLNYVTYFHAFVEYGFTLLGARKITLAENNKIEISKIFSAITYSKILNSIISFSVLAVVGLFALEREQQYQCLLILTIWIFSEVFTQTYIFQGLQDMKFIMAVNVISRTVSTVLTFIFVKNPEDILIYAILYVVTNVLSAFLGTALIVGKFKIRLTKPNYKDIVDVYKEGFPLFTTSFASKICSGFTVTALGFFCTDAVIGGYTAIQKIPYILVIMFAPVGQVIYPYICKLYETNIELAIRRIKKILLAILVVCAVGFLTMLFLKDVMIRIVYGEEYLPYSNLIIPLSLWLVFSITNNILGIQILVARGNQKEYSVCFIISIIALVIFNLVLCYMFGAWGGAIATAVGELTLTCCCLYVIWKKRLLNIN